MADSLLDIGTEEIFPFSPNWQSLIDSSIILPRYFSEYRGSSNLIQQSQGDVPISFGISVDLIGMENIYSFIDFINTIYGRLTRFWIKYPKQLFKLAETIASGASIITVLKNDFNNQYQGYERIFIEMYDGDILTRKVTAATYNSTTGYIELSLNNTLDRELTQSTVIAIGRYLLCRFDMDEFQLKVETDRHLFVSLKFLELIKEYSEI